MSRKTEILKKALVLFNRRGLSLVSPRDIASSLDIAYGNLTYHFPKKEDIVLSLYQAMMDEHQAIAQSFKPDNDLLHMILSAPAGTFSLSLKYLFLFRDYVEIMRLYQSVVILKRKTIATHKSNLIGLFTALQSQGLFRKDLDQEDIDYLMDLSGFGRTFFMMNLSSSDLRSVNHAGLKIKYITFVNRILFPYLTPKGIIGFKKFKIS